MPDLPTGTVTLLFTDMEGSTHLLQQLGEQYGAVLTDCRHLLRKIFVQYNGHEVDTQGDAFFVAFARASDAVSAAIEIQRALANHAWPEGISVRVRIGLHTGEPKLTADGYIGVDVHHAARIMSTGHGGQILLSPTTRQLVEQHLPTGTYLQDLGEHRLKDLQRPSHLFQLSVQGLTTAFPPLKTLDTQRNNLPIQPTPFIGREKEVAAVTQLLRRADVQLITLTGTGGVGKTRLGLHVAAELSDDFTDGVFVVALAPVNDPAQVIPAIAQTLTISEASERPLFTLLQAFLKEKQLLLLLDNFEQVGDAAVMLAELLATCPRLKVIVTSRVGLHVRAEHEFVVPPLSVPTLKQLPDLKTLSHYEAVTLFIERAQAMKPDFSVTNTNAPAVAAICAHLDGLPLAIELAAARVKHFSPQTLLARLEQGLSVLSGGARDLPTRQQTLRGAIAWSYDLLSPQEQKLFRHLAVFVDGWSLEAAEAICKARGKLADDMLEAMASLVDKSLLRQEEQVAGETRFWMLQTLREFGLEQLARNEELEATRQAHAEYYLWLAEDIGPELQATEQGRSMARLEQEHENLRAALSWLVAQAQRGSDYSSQQAERVLRFCTALSWFWSIRGYSREGLHFLEQALALGKSLSAPVKARAFTMAADLAFLLDDTERTEELAGESLHLFRELGDKAGMADALFLLGGGCAWARGQYTRARSQLKEATSLYQELGEQWKYGRCLTQLARISTVQGEYESAQELLEQSLALYRALGDKERLGWVLYLQARQFFLSGRNIAAACSLTEQSLSLLQEIDNPWERAYPLVLLGQITLWQTDQVRAQTLFEEGRSSFKEVGDHAGMAEALIGLASVDAVHGDFVAARDLYQECFPILQRIQVQELIPACLEGLATVAVEQGELAWAAHLWGAAEALRESLGTPIPAVYQLDYEQAVTKARAQAGNEAFARTWAEGRGMTPEQAMAANYSGGM
ncbi:MAG TPA: adenylate/guanylate cyclase domain-containing protein [Ktedonobacteraceae bacterium]|nr:adenylate/guanylate cyclase domain-containing protein [Ktedonobacteraceae bacterium]